MGLRKAKLTIESNLDDVPLIGIAVNRFCTYAGFSETEASNLELCVIEAVNNCIKHAYGEETGHEVMMTFTLSKNEALFEICDRGKPMDPKRLKEAALTQCQTEKECADSISDSGRGLAIMKEIMDNVVYRSENDVNCLTMKKQIP